MTNGPSDSPKKRSRLRVGCAVVAILFVVFVAIYVPIALRDCCRSKTPAAQMGVRKMFDGAVTYYLTAHLDADGNPLPPRFPTAGETGVCVMGANGRAVPAGRRRAHIHHDGTPGQAACWDALGFRPADPERFMFVFEADNSVAGEESFVAYAYGDLDGDGVWSTFARAGRVVDGEVEGVGGLYIENQLE